MERGFLKRTYRRIKDFLSVNWFLAVPLLLAFLLRLPYFSQPPDYDESSMAFSGFYSRGGSFYFPLESFPTSGRLPGMFLIYRFADNLFPQNFAFIRLVSTLFVFVAILAVYLIGKMMKNEKVGFWAALILAVFTSQISTASPANAEFFMVPLVALSYYSFLLYLKKEKSHLLIISGLIGGAAILIKQVAIFQLLVLGLWLVFSTTERLKMEISLNLDKKISRCLKTIFQIFIFIFSLTVPLIITIVLFFIHGQLNDLWVHGFGAGSSYVTSGWSGNGWKSRLWSILYLFRKKYWFFFLTGLGGAFLIIRKKEKVLNFVSIWLFFSLIEAVFTGFFFDHYFVAMIPPLSVLGGVFLFSITEYLKNKYLRIIFIIFMVTIMVKNSFLPCLSYFKWKIGLIDQKEHWQNIGQDIGAAGWIPFMDSANYLKEQMEDKDTFFAWVTSPITYYLINKRPIIDFFQYNSVLGHEFMLPTYKGFPFDFAGNRERLMQKLESFLPTYILFYVTPEQVFDQLFLFKDFSNFLSRNYSFKKQFGNIIIFKANPSKVDPKADEEMVSIPLELVKRYSVFSNMENTKRGMIVSFEPMVNPNGILRSFKSIYPNPQLIKFTPLVIQLIEIGKEDHVGFGVHKPSGTPDLHIRVKGLPELTSFIRVKIGNFAWNNQSYGVNPIIKVVQKDDIFDLYMEPIKIEKGQILELYFIYTNGQVGVERLQLE